MINLQITKKELNTILMALRTYQNVDDDFRVGMEIYYGQDYDVLTDDEIDELCERINLGE